MDDHHVSDCAISSVAPRSD